MACSFALDANSPGRVIWTLACITFLFGILERTV